MTVTTTHSITTTVSGFIANTYVDGNEFGSTVVSTGSGGFLLSYGWAVGGNVGPLVDFYANGTAAPSRGFLIPYGVSNSDVDMIGDPDIIRLANGNYAVVWDSATQGGGDIRGAIFSSNGTIVAADFEVSSFSVDTDPQLAALTNGNWVASMTSGNNVYLQLMSAGGGKIGGQISVDSGGSDIDPSITALNDGGFAVAWTEDIGVGNDSVWTAIYNSDGSVRQAPTERGFGFAGNNNSQSGLAALQNGNFALVYTDSGWSDDGLSLHIITAAGVDLTGPIRIDPPSLSVAIEQDPEVSVLSNGFIVVTWTHPFSGTDNDIYGRIFTQSGTPVEVNGADHFIIEGNGQNQTRSSVAALLEGRFVTSWTDSQIEPGGAANSIRAEVNQITETLTSDGAGDAMTGSSLTSFMFGNDGDDTMAGGGGLDTLFGGGGNDTIFSDGDSGRYDGGTGDDLMESGGGGETMLGGDGNDTIDHSWFNGNYNFDMTTGLTNFGSESYTQFETAIMGGGDDSVSGTTGRDTILGGDGNDRLFGLGGNDRLNGGGGNDTMEGGLGNDRYVVGSVDDVIQGEIGFSLGGGIDTVESFISYTLTSNLEILRLQGSGNLSGFGNAAPEGIIGNSGNNIIGAGGGNDKLNGKGGSDTITGGNGSDTIVGDTGADTFIYTAASESGAGQGVRDFLNGFTHGQDRIDLSLIDANSLTGANDAFSFIGNAAFQAGAIHAGQLRYSTVTANSVLVSGDRNGDAVADFQIFVNLTNFMQAGDFIL